MADVKTDTEGGFYASTSDSRTQANIRRSNMKGPNGTNDAPKTKAQRMSGQLVFSITWSKA